MNANRVSGGRNHELLAKKDAAKGEDQMKIGADGVLVLGHDVTLVSNHDAQMTHTLLATNLFLPIAAGTVTAAY